MDREQFHVLNCVISYPIILKDAKTGPESVMQQLERVKGRLLSLEEIRVMDPKYGFRHYVIEGI